ncbi:MAG: AAA family ATPase [Bacteroidota bacterium]|nr:AAA family ATPase [Bacteroidota bacterium]
MEKLIQQFRTRLNSVDLSFKRYLWEQINWKNRLSAIVGARGVGKTTLLLQHIKQNHKNLDDVLYVSLDNLYFSKTTLSDFTDEFVKQGGKYLFIDEVHKYPDWSVEIKNIYDTYPELSIVITGSSALDIHKGKGDLSRRIIIYKMNGLSFREFILFKYNINFPVYSLSEILQNANEIAETINNSIKPIKYFGEYLKTGYYPFFTEDEEGYYERIEQTVTQIIENDLHSIENIDYTAIHNLRKLLTIIAEIVPFKPNISKLSLKIGINRETLVKYLYWLHRAELLLLLTTNKFGISKLNKPDKVYLNNPNLIYALTESKVNVGTLRETFFYNQLHVNHKINYTDRSDFLIDNTYIFEIGGKNKTRKQIAGIKNAYIAADNIEYPHKNTIPVWMFGFLY